MTRALLLLATPQSQASQQTVDERLPCWQWLATCLLLAKQNIVMPPRPAVKTAVLAHTMLTVAWQGTHQACERYDSLLTQLRLPSAHTLQESVGERLTRSIVLSAWHCSIALLPAMGGGWWTPSSCTCPFICTLTCDNCSSPHGRCLAAYGVRPGLVAFLPSVYCFCCC